ncbi:MAG: CrcB family protein [Geodermatophilaceae bacterium]|nr:CrcB family protein [Geodermatophilaceae bacterium]
MRPGVGDWKILAAVSAGGVLGGTARYGVEQIVPVRADGFPWGTFTVNVVGAFVLGFVLVLSFEPRPDRRYLRPFVAIGFLGSFTTFSTWMLQVYELADAGRVGLAAGYLGASLVAGLVVTGLGLVLGRALLRRRSPGGDPV